MAKLIEVKNDLEVKKSEVIVTARYKLNTLSLKFITSLIAGLKRSDEIDEQYVFKVSEFKELTGLSRKDIYKAVELSLKEILSKPLKIEIDKDKFLMVNWVSSAYYENGQVSFMIDKRLRPYLLEAQQKFLKYKLENILPLKSRYSIRMYEILKDYYNTQSRYGNKVEKILEISRLREILGIPKSYKYGNSSGIKQRILEKSKQELKENTDIIFNYQEIKTGRKVTHLRFIIYQNPKKLQTGNGVQEQYFKSRKNFVALLRKKFSGTGMFFGFKNINRINYWLGLDNNGLVYGVNGEEIKDFNAIESAELYELWLKIAQNSDIYRQLVEQGVSLKELAEDNKELWLELKEDIIGLKEEGII